MGKEMERTCGDRMLDRYPKSVSGNTDGAMR